jgi:hypothetical protein
VNPIRENYTWFIDFLPISGALVTDGSPALLRLAFSSDGEDLVHRSSGMLGLLFELLLLTETLLRLLRT